MANVTRADGEEWCEPLPLGGVSIPGLGRVEDEVAKMVYRIEVRIANLAPGLCSRNRALYLPFI
jgi:hypothetical protein